MSLGVALRIWGAGQAVARKELNMESTRKLSKFNFQGTKTLCQNNLKNIAFFFTFFKSYRCLLVICNNTKKNFSWEPEKINVKFHNITSCTRNFQNFTSPVFSKLL